MRQLFCACSKLTIFGIDNCRHLSCGRINKNIPRSEIAMDIDHFYARSLEA